MARYIDADKIVYWTRYVSPNGLEHDVRKVAFRDEIERMQTADVAPKSEVDWNSIPVDVSEALKQRAVEKAKAEAAREIFEEIEKEIELALESNYRAKAERLAKPNVDMADEFIAYCEGKIATLRGIEGFAEELKKKYTEEKL